MFLMLPGEALCQDTDGDGMPDVFENAHGCLMANTADGGVDYEPDGMTSLDEYNYFLVNPYEGSLYPCDPDTDNDGVNDGDEFNAGSNPAWEEVTPGVALVGGSDKRITYSPEYP